MKCACPVRGFRNEQLAMHVYHAMTARVGLTKAHDFYRCAQGWWHWETATKETA